MKIISKKSTIIFLVLILFFGLLLVNIKPAGASFGSWVLNSVAAPMITGIFSFLLAIAQLLTGLIGKLFSYMLDFGFQDMKMVHTGWVMVRDIVNMFFILGLIVIAFANILRLEGYMMKHLLPKLIIMALIINFSYVACGAIIDSSQMIANYFLDQIQNQEGTRADVGLGILDKIGVLKSIQGTETQSVLLTEQDPAMATALSTAFAAMITGIAGFVLLVGAVLLMIRIGALWALIIISPLAWFASIFPPLKSHAGKWWSEFLKWSFFAPIYVFFIYLILNLSFETKTATMGETSAVLQGTSLSSMTSNLQVFFNFVFLSILLFGAPQVAMAMGIRATDMAKKIALGGLGLAYKLPGKLRNAMVTPPGFLKAIPGVRKVTRGISTIAKWTSPEFWKEAAKRRKEEIRREERVGRHVGRTQDVMNRILSLGFRKTHHAEEMEQMEVDEKKKEITLETKGVGGALIEKAKKSYRKRDMVAFKACMELLQENGDTNDSMISDLFAEFEYAQELNDSSYNLQGKIHADPAHRSFSNLGFKHALVQSMRKMGENDSSIASFFSKIQNIALDKGYFGLYGIAHVDEKTGKLSIATDQQQIDTATYKYKVMTPRMRTSKLHTTSYIKQGGAKDHYTFEDFDEVGKELLRNTNLGDIAKMNTEYIRPDTRDAIADGFKQQPNELKALGAGAYALGFKLDFFDRNGRDAKPEEIDDALEKTGLKKASEEKKEKTTKEKADEKAREEHRKKAGYE